MAEITKRFRLMQGHSCLGTLLRVDADFPWHFCEWHASEAFAPYAEAFEHLQQAAEKRCKDYKDKALLAEWEAANDHIKSLGLSIVEFAEPEDDWEITYQEPEEMFILFINGDSARWRS